ncbi:hypothetical protein [uncultured Shewanella sp.]|uniref:hypothetical protein n=1 Tax=uncultured Shewanella sp. TaxID=173975 RepID=UPI002626796D|nr:hypothetical protein [uncultured Shewanella sp.]
MFTLTNITNTAKKGLVSFVLLTGLTVSAHADSLFDIDLSRHIENSMTTQMDEAVDSLKSELSLLIQLQMAEMLFEHELDAAFDSASKTAVENTKSQMWEQE